MAHSLALATYVALRGRGKDGVSRDPRPDGPLVWFHCPTTCDLLHAQSVIDTLQDDQEQVSFLITGTQSEPEVSDDGDVIIGTGPGRTKAEVEGFLDHWLPDALFWLGGQVDPLVVAVVKERPIRRFLVNIRSDDPIVTGGGWLPGIKSDTISEFETAFAADTMTATRLIRLGMSQEAVTVTGSFTESIPVLPYNEAERADFAQVVGSRPMWLASDVPVQELEGVIAAHKNALRRSHRLLLILEPRNPEDGPIYAEAVEKAKLKAVLRSEDDPKDTTHVYIADLGQERGMWFRIAPTTYIGGTILGGGRHPFEPASLGSVVVHGPENKPYQDAYGRLDKAGGAKAVKNNVELASAIEKLLSPDKAAQIAHAAWAVTSQGAEVTNRVASMIASLLDTLDH